MKGVFKLRNPQKYLGDKNRIFWRSSWELKCFMALDHDPSVLKWSSEETIVPYHSPIDNKWHRYFPDCYVELDNGKKEIWEIKPEKETKPPVERKNNKKKFIMEALIYAKNVAKWQAAERYCKQRGYTFKILTEKELGIPKWQSKNSKST